MIAHEKHVVTVRPTRLRDSPVELGCDRLRGIGYRFFCSCGANGTRWPTHREARAEGKWHTGEAIKA